MKPTPYDLEAKLITHLGYRYGFNHRCDGTTGEHDCSGYQVWGMNSIGAYLPCTSSFVLAQMCTDAGLEVSYDDLYNGLPGWAFRGLDHGRRTGGARNGSDGHIVYVNMKMREPVTEYPLGGTLEAMGRAYGVRRGVFNLTRKFSGFYRIVGLDYSTRSARERDMIIQRFHYNANGDKTGPVAPHPSGNAAFHIVAPDGRHVESRWNASTANDQSGNNEAQKLRLWAPADIGGARITGMTRTADDNPHPGYVVALDDGRARPARFS